MSSDIRKITLPAGRQFVDVSDVLTWIVEAKFPIPDVRPELSNLRKRVPQEDPHGFKDAELDEGDLDLLARIWQAVPGAWPLTVFGLKRVNETERPRNPYRDEFEKFAQAFDMSPDRPAWRLSPEFTNYARHAEKRRQSAKQEHWENMEREAAEGRIRLLGAGGAPTAKIDWQTQISVEDARKYLACVPPGFVLEVAPAEIAPATVVRPPAEAPPESKERRSDGRRIAFLSLNEVLDAMARAGLAGAGAVNPISYAHRYRDAAIQLHELLSVDGNRPVWCEVHPITKRPVPRDGAHAEGLEVLVQVVEFQNWRTTMDEEHRQLCIKRGKSLDEVPMQPSQPAPGGLNSNRQFEVGFDRHAVADFLSRHGVEHGLGGTSPAPLQVGAVPAPVVTDSASNVLPALTTSDPLQEFRDLDGLSFSEVSISFVGDRFDEGDRVGANSQMDVSARGRTRRVPLALLGLIDGRSGELNQPGKVLLRCALGSKQETDDAGKQAISRTRKLLKEKFGIRADPFQRYHTKTGWAPVFEVTERRGLADERARREAERLTVSFDRLREVGREPGATFDDDEGGRWLRENDPEYGV